MPKEKLNFERITHIYREERRKKGLTPLPQDFFGELGEYIGELIKRSEEEEGRDPGSPKTVILRDELKKVLKKREEIWLLRLRKVVTSASSKLMGASIDLKLLTREERNLYERIVDILEEGTNEVYGFGKTRELEDRIYEGVPTKGDIKEDKIGAQVKLEGKPKKQVIPQPHKDLKKELRNTVIVHILEDLPPMVGKDKNYMLKKNDVVTLPNEIASILVNKKKAKKIESAV